MGNIRLYGATSGYTELAPPAVAPDGVLSLPSGTGTLLTAEGGKILQIVRATDTTRRDTSSATYVDVTGMSVTITPQKSTSTILVMSLFLGWANGSNPVGEYGITDSSNNLLSGAENGQLSGVLSDLRVSVCLVGYSTPGTTSATTYKLRFRNNSSTTTTLRNDLQTGQMYAIEVSA